jgi:acyl carrier protein
MPDNKLKLYEDIFIKTFGTNSKKLKKLKYKSINEWDSIGHMNLMSELEKKFKIQIDIDDIVDFSSFEKGKKILKKYKVNLK